jgi:hypothetical protein
VTITRDQTATGQADADNTAVITLTWATAPTAGSNALVYIGSTASVSTVKDNGSTQSTFTQDALSTTDGTLAVYRADGIHLPSSGSYTVTVTLSGDAYAHASGRTYLGMATGGPSATNSGSGTGTSVATGNVTPPATGSLVAGVFADASSANPETITLTTSGASTVYSSTNGAADLAGASADNITTTVTAQGLAWTIGDSTGWDALVAVYGPAAASSAAPQPARAVQAVKRAAYY